MRLLLPLLLAISGHAGEWQAYDANRCVPYQDGQGICRIAWDWFVQNDGQVSCYSQNGGPWQGCESGTWSLRLLDCWPIATGQDVRVIVLDIAGIHADRVMELARKVSEADVSLLPLSRFYPDDVIAGIRSAVDAGAQIVVLPLGIVNPRGNDPLLLAAMEYGGTRGVAFVCAAPNDGRNLDTQPDYPCSWDLPYAIGVSCGMMDGTLYQFSAHGTNLLCFPGRNLVAAGVYYSGTSSASGVAAGCLAAMMERKPNRTPSRHKQALRYTATEAWNRVNFFAALNN